VVTNERNDENDTDEGNEFHTFIILSAEKVLRMLCVQHDLYNLYPWPRRVLVTVLISKEIF